MRKLRALDLFCCAGGAGMGLHRAGFEVVGVDIRPQPRYPFEFHQADALTFAADDFDFIWASPPCQAHTSLKTMHNAVPHVDLIPPTREKLKAWQVSRGNRGKLAMWAMENVVGAPLVDPVTLCGTMFGLGVEGAELRRHRQFETSWPIFWPPQCNHTADRTIGIYGEGCRDSRRKYDKSIPEFTVNHGREAMECDWMTLAELCQAIPPAYSEFIGRAAIDHIEASRLAA